MTSCPSEEGLVLLADGALPAAEAEPVETHLVACADCRRLLARNEAALRLALGGLADGDDAARVAPVAPARRTLQFPVGRLAAAAAVAAAVVAATLLRPSAPGPRPEPAAVSTTAAGFVARSAPARTVDDLIVEARRLASAPADDDAADLEAEAALAAAQARVALDLPTAEARLGDVVERFPGTDAAREARAQLAVLDSEGDDR